MVTELRKYITETSRLREIQVLTLSPEFKKLSNRKLIKLRTESSELILKIGGTSHNHTFNDIETRINDRLGSSVGLRRFIIQLVLSIVILIVTLLSVFVEFPIGADSVGTKQQQTQQSK